MSFQQAIKQFFVKYVIFQGRASRREYWLAFLFVVLVSTAAGIIDPSHKDYDSRLQSLWSLATALPLISAGARRLHDMGRSAKYLFWLLLPIPGWILLAIWLSKESQPGANQYGESLNPGSTGK